MLRDEKRNIERFINEKGLQVEVGQENQTEFKKGVYYKFPNGLYMMVLEKGEDRPVAGKTRVIARFKGHMFAEKNLTSFDNLSEAGYQNTEFLYVELYSRGAINFQLLPAAPGSNLNSIMCQGIAYPLTMLGDGAKVSLIIPFLIGPETAFNTGISMFCEEVHYEFIDS